MKRFLHRWFGSDCRRAMTCAAASRDALLALETRLKETGDRRALVLARSLHESLAATADEVGRLVGVDVSPLSGGGPKPDEVPE
jgi:hypothetical protein